jgi:hypothetical protein
MPFRLQSLSSRSFRWPGSFPSFGFDPRFQNHLPQAIQNFLAIGALAAMAVFAEMNFTGVRQSSAGEMAKAVDRGIRKTFYGIEFEPEFRLGVEFVDILAARAAAARELKAQSARQRTDAGGEFRWIIGIIGNGKIRRVHG